MQRFAVIFGLVFLGACSSQATTMPSPMASYKPETTSSPTFIPTYPPQPTNTPTPTLIPLAVLPPLNKPEQHPLAISPENAHKIEELTSFGKGWIFNAVWSPRGDVIAAATVTGVYLYDPNSLEQIGHLDTGITQNIAISPGGDYLAVDYEIWEISTRKMIREFENPSSYRGINNVAFSPDGSKIVVYATAAEHHEDERAAVIVWDFLSGQELFVHEIETFYYFSQAAFSQDSRLLIVGGWYLIKVLDANTGERIQKFETDGINAVYYLEKNHIISGWGEIWDLESGELVQDLQLRTSNVIFNSESNLLVFWTDIGPGAVQAWDATTYELVSTIPDASRAGILGFSPDGNKLLINTSRLEIWDIESSSMESIIDEFGSSLHSITHSPEGNRIAIGRFKSIWVGNANTMEQLHVLNYPTRANVDMIIFSPDGQYIIAQLTGDGYLIWDLESENMVRGSSDACSVALSPDGQQIAIAEDWEIGIYDFTSGNRITSHKHRLAGQCLDNLIFSPDGEYIVGTGPGLYLFSLSTGEETVIVGDGDVEPIYWNDMREIAFSPKGDLLMVGGAGFPTNTTIWRFPELSMSHNLEGPAGSVQGEGYAEGAVELTFSPDGNILAATYTDASIIFWDMNTGKQLWSTRRYDYPTGISFNPNGQTFTVVYSDGIIRIYGIPPE